MYGDSYNSNNNSFGGGYNSFSQGNGNDYGGASQFGGGDDGGGFIMPMSQSSPSGGERKQRPAQTLLATSIKRLNEAEYVDSKFMIDGKEIKQVTIVGVIVSVEVQAMNTTYLLDDGTGCIAVPKYSDTDAGDSQINSTLREGMYVRVFGNLRTFTSTRSVVAFQLQPVTDFNEITYHLLEIIHSHLLVTRGAPGAQVKPEQKSYQPMSNMGGGMQSNQPNNFTAMSGGDNGQFSNVQQRVLDIFSRDQSDAGSSISAVCNEMSGVSMSDIRSAVDFLTEEGHLYSTIDDDHFKATHSM